MNIEKQKFVSAVKNFKWSFSFDSAGHFVITSHGTRTAVIHFRTMADSRMSFLFIEENIELTNTLGKYDYDFESKMIRSMSDIHRLEIKKVYP